MWPALRPRALAAFAFAFASLALVSLAAGAARAAEPPAAGAPAREALLTTPANLPPALLGQKVAAKLTVRAHVAASGLVDSAKAVAGDERLRAAAEAAVRWWVFAPAAAPSWVSVTVPVEADADAPPLYPDVLALARQAESSGDPATALASWTGALARVGSSPAVLDEWALRERAIAVARRLPYDPPASAVVGARARGARGEQLRTVARARHAELVATFDHALLRAPWWDEPYLWRAGSLAGCGRTAEALRSLRAYRLATRDTAGAAFAARLADRLAAADTVGVCEAIKTWRVVSEPRTR